MYRVLLGKQLLVGIRSTQEDSVVAPKAACFVHLFPTGALTAMHRRVPVSMWCVKEQSLRYFSL